MTPRLPALLSLLPLAAGCVLGSDTVYLPETRPDGACEADAFEDGPLAFQVRMPERTRQALVWMPSGPGPHDVVVNLHEYRAAPERQAWYSRWWPFAEEADVILVTPDGKAATWNVGPCCGRASSKYHTDDAAFLDAVVAHLDTIGCTSGRVLATGIGNGAMMAQHWSCRSDVPDAVVSVGGALQVDDCPNETPVPLLHYHGRDDTFIPASGEGGRLAEATMPLATARAQWVARNGNAAEPEVRTDGQLTCERHPGGQAATEVCFVAGHGDIWPGSDNGQVTSDDPLADATRGAWGWVQAQWDAAARAEPTPPGDGAEASPSAPPPAGAGAEARPSAQDTPAEAAPDGATPSEAAEEPAPHEAAEEPAPHEAADAPGSAEGSGAASPPADERPPGAADAP